MQPLKPTKLDDFFMPLLPFILLLLIIVPDCYIWWTHVRGNVAPFWNFMYWAPLLLTIAGIGCFVLGHADHWVLKVTFCLFLCFCLPKICFMVFALVGRMLSLLHPTCAAVGAWLGLSVGLLTFGMALYGFLQGWQRLTVKTESVRIQNLPASFEGYKIVQISDLHLGTFGTDTSYIHKMVRHVNELRPDMIVFTGDLVNTSPDELAPFKPILSHLYAKDGVFSIMGNHDYTTYHPNKDIGARKARITQLQQSQREMGWQLLQNEARIIHRNTDSLFIAGVENVARPPFPSFGDLKKTMSNIPHDAPVILLSHDPTHWRREVIPLFPNIKLTLSGHTHAMQFKIAGFSPSQWIYPEWGGHYREGTQHLIVSTGAGSNIPFRFGAWPEVVEIELTH